MKIELTDISAVKKSLTIEADAEDVRRETEAVLRRYASQARIPGFRPGKAPLELVRTRFASQISDDVRERLVGRLYSEATREKGLRPLGDPALEEISKESEEPLRFKTTFEVLPQLTPKGYRGVEVREPKVAVEEEDVERALESLRQSQARFVTEDGRAAAAGDVVVADVEGTPAGGETFRRERVVIALGAEDNLPEFNDKLPGVAAGSSLEFDVEYPEAYSAKELAGKPVSYKLHVHEVKRKEVPPLDDELAKDLGEFADLASLRERVRGDLLEEKRHVSQRGTRQSILDKVLVENPVVLPDVLVDEEIQHRLEDMVRMMAMQGVDPRTLDVDWKQLRDRQEEPARKTVHAKLVLDAIAAIEHVEASDDEIEAYVRREAQRMGEKHEKLLARIEKSGGREALRAQLVREKTLDFLSSVANIQRGD
jgi:trigger factor